MELSINDLGMVWETVYEARTKAYEIGLILKVVVDTLDSIDERYDDSSDKLREVLKTWLRTAPKPTWQDILDALRSRVVGQSKLARDIEAKHKLRSTVEAAHVSRETIPEVLPQQPTSAATQQHSLQQELQDCQRQNEELAHQVEKKNQQLQSIEKDLLQREQTIGELRAAIDQLKRQLQQAQQQVKHATEERESQVRELTEQLLAIKQPEPPPQTTDMQQKAIQDMKWKKESKAPEEMYRGSAAADANMAYLNGRGHTTVHSYDSDTQEWRQLPDVPHTHSTLVVVHHILTMVGGLRSGRATDSLLSLTGEGKGEKWLPDIPAMPTKRYCTAVVCSGRSLIVAGGEDDNNTLATVEVLDTDTRQWSTASSLPHPLYLATISICGEKLYMLGGDDQTGRATSSVLSCSTPELLQSCQTQSLAGNPRTAPANKSAIWRHVADAPHTVSSCATLCGQLVAVGGFEAGKHISTITVYNETTDSWEAMGDMPTARSWALLAILNGKMMVVGGWLVGRTATDVVEILG